MKVQRTDIDNLLRETCTHLEELQKKIHQGVQTFSEEDLSTILKTINKDGHELARSIMQSIEIAPIKKEMKDKLVHLIHAIQGSHEFLTTVGSMQIDFRKALNRIENSLEKSEEKKKVTKAEGEPL